MFRGRRLEFSQLTPHYPAPFSHSLSPNSRFPSTRSSVFTFFYISDMLVTLHTLVYSIALSIRFLKDIDEYLQEAASTPGWNHYEASLQPGPVNLKPRT